MEGNTKTFHLDIGDTNCFIAMPVNRDLPWQTALSLVETVNNLGWSRIPHSLQFLTQGSQIDHDRSALAHEFLKTDCDRIFWIDSDMSFKADAFKRILALSTVMPIVGASYPAKQDGRTEFLVALNSLEMESNEYGCVPVDGFGLGFCCIQREVIEKCAEVSQEFLDNGKPLKMIFRTGIDPGDGLYRSEDMHFFKLCRSLGYKVWIDPTVELGHIGCKEHRGKMIDALTPKEVEVAACA